MNIKMNIKKFLCLSNIFLFSGFLDYTSFANADVDGIPYNSDFNKAQYPYAQAPDGCSSWDSDHPEWMPDTWGPVNFSGGCNTHDKCYYTLDSNWQSCNKRFYSDLRAACERDLRVWVPPAKPLVLFGPEITPGFYTPPDPIRLASCYEIATAYYTGVQAGVVKIKWLDTFNKAQDKQRRYEQWVATIKPSTKLRSGGTVSTDFDGDGKADRYKKTDDGRLLIDYAKNGFGKWDESYKDYGGPGAQLVPADYDRDGKADISVKLDSGEWLIDYAKNGFGKWDESHKDYGGPGAHPVPADYDGDGKADISIKLDSGEWLIDYAKNGFGKWDETH
jgi:hypothetical protein